MNKILPNMLQKKKTSYDTIYKKKKDVNVW